MCARLSVLAGGVLSTDGHPAHPVFEPIIRPIEKDTSPVGPVVTKYEIPGVQQKSTCAFFFSMSEMRQL